MQKKILLISLAICFLVKLKAQEVLTLPYASYLYAPYLLNPACSGNREFSTIDCIASFQEDQHEFILGGNKRLMKKNKPNLLYPNYQEYSGIGIGGNLIWFSTSTSQFMGGSGKFSYHIPLGKDRLSYFAAGISANGIYNSQDGSFNPSADLGIYMYGPHFFAGYSENNLFGSKNKPDSINSGIPKGLSGNYVIAGYRFQVCKRTEFVFEPSLLLTVDDSIATGIKNRIHPTVKLYFGSTCLGTCLDDYHHMSFFFQYKFPLIYIGILASIPLDAPYFRYNSVPTAQLSMGLNLHQGHSFNQALTHW